MPVKITLPWLKYLHSSVRSFFVWLPWTAMLGLIIILVFFLLHVFPSVERKPLAGELTPGEVQKLRELVIRQTPPPNKPSELVKPVAPVKPAKPGDKDKASQNEEPVVAPWNKDEVSKLRILSLFQDKLTNNMLNTEEADKLKEDTKRYLEWVIAIAGFFSIAQTIAAGFLAQSFAKQAERDVSEIEEWKQKYRNLTLLDEKQNQALGKLRRAYDKQQESKGILPTANRNLVGWIDWRNNLFENMKMVDRQELLSVDRYLGFDLKLDSFPDDDTRANIIRLLANFYVTKYEYEKKVKAGNWDDLERAEYLLRLWLRDQPDQFQCRSDLGLVLKMYADNCNTVADKVKYMRLAQEEFQSSVNYQSKQQRAYFNLGIIAFELAEIKKFKTPATIAEGIRALQSALALFAEASKHSDRWEMNRNPPMATELLYNIACYQGMWVFLTRRNRGVSVPTDVAQPVLQNLEMVAKKGTIKKRYIDNDFRPPDGQIACFRSLLSQTDMTSLDQIRPLLSRHQEVD